MTMFREPLSPLSRSIAANLYIHFFLQGIGLVLKMILMMIHTFHIKRFFQFIMIPIVFSNIIRSYTIFNGAIIIPFPLCVCFHYSCDTSFQTKGFVKMTLGSLNTISSYSFDFNPISANLYFFLICNKDCIVFDLAYRKTKSN